MVVGIGTCALAVTLFVVRTFYFPIDDGVNRRKMMLLKEMNHDQGPGVTAPSQEAPRPYWNIADLMAAANRTTTFNASPTAGMEAIPQIVPFPVEPDQSTDRNADGHLVRYLCNAGHVETLFFVHTNPTRRRERELYRATIGHGNLRKVFKWTTVFFVGLRPGTNLSQEALQYGDIVQLPFLDSYRNLTYKFVYGMRWVLLHCPAVRWAVKIDDDVFLNPTRLYQYLKIVMPLAHGAIHCSVYVGNDVIRNPHSRHYLSRQEYRQRAFPPHCHGWLIILPATVMRSLYMGAFRVPRHSIDDVYVTGDVAKKVGVRHVDMTPLLDDDNVFGVLRGDMLALLFNGRCTWSTRFELWKTLAAMRHTLYVKQAMLRTLENFTVGRFAELN